MIVVVTNVFSAPDGSSPATAITRPIIEELVGQEDGGGTTEESTAG